MSDAPTPPCTSINAITLTRLVGVANSLAHLEGAGIGGAVVGLRFGEQVDSQQVSDEDAAESRRVAGYLARYVTKPASDFGLKPRRVAPHLSESREVSAHTKQLLHTVARLSNEADRSEMAKWLHTLGYRGHVSSKSRPYSTTMTALRATRAD